MVQVQIEFNRVTTPDLSPYARSRATNLPGTQDFASMIDAASTAASTPAPPATQVDPRPATSSSQHSDGSSPRRNDSTGSSDRSAPERVDRSTEPATPGSDTTKTATPGSDTTAPAAFGDDSPQHAARRPPYLPDSPPAPAPHAISGSSDDSDQSTASDDDDLDTATDTPAASPAVVAAPAMAPFTPAPDSPPADDATMIDAGAAASISGAGRQTKDASAHADAEFAPATELGKPASPAILAALGQGDPDGETVSDDGEAASPDTAEAHVIPANPSVEAKLGKADDIQVGGEAGTLPQSVEASVDGQQDQPLQPDASDAADPPEPLQDSPHKDVHTHAAVAAGRSDTKDRSDDLASVRSETLDIGAVQAAAGSDHASVTMSVGAQAGIAAIGTASAGAGTAATATAASRADPSNTTATLAEIGVAIATQAKAGNRSFDIRLDPPELGRIHVRLDVDRDGNVISRLIVDRVDTLDLLRRDAPQLQRALQDAGLKADAQTMQFSLRDQNAGQQGGGHTPYSTPRTADLDAGTRIDEVPLTYGRLSSRAGGLDIRI